jgi:hypothetical protein
LAKRIKALSLTLSQRARELVAISLTLSQRAKELMNVDSLSLWERAIKNTSQFPNHGIFFYPL